MLDGIRKRLTYANVMATAAVFIALGGSSYAALQLTANSVKSRQLAPGAVKTSDIASRAVTAKKLASGVGGPTGYAYVTDGVVSGGRGVSVGGGGLYCLQLASTPRAITATLGRDIFVPPNVVVDAATIQAEIGTSQGCPTADAWVLVESHQSQAIRGNFHFVYWS